MKKWLWILVFLNCNLGFAANLNHLTATPETRKQLFQAAKWPAECEKEYSSDQASMPTEIIKRGGLTIYPLNKTQSLIQVLCFVAAYQSNYYYVLADSEKNTAQLIDFKLFDFDNKHQAITSMQKNVAGLPSFKNKLLTLFSKARGIGDCGSLVVYGFTKQGKSYVVTARAKECNDEGKFENPENWPLIERGER